MKRRVAIICILTYFAALRLDIDGSLDFVHEGDRLAHIDALRDGKLPFRDIYVQQGLGENILKPMLACAWFGTDVAALRKFGSNAFLYRGILPPLGLVATIIAVAALTRRWQACAVVAILLLICWVEVTDRHVLGLFAIAATGQFLYLRKRSWLVAAGAMASLAVLYSLDVGLFVMISIAAWCVLDVHVSRPVSAPCQEITRRWAYMTAGAIAAFLPFLAWCAWHGIIGDFGVNVYWQIFLRSEAMPVIYPRPWNSEAIRENTTLIGCSSIFNWYYLLPLSVAVIAIAAFHTHAWPAKLRSAILLCAATALMFWLTVVGRPDEWHVAYAASPFLMVASMLVIPMRHWLATQIEGAKSGKRNSLRWMRVAIVPTVVMLIWCGEGGVVRFRLSGKENSRAPKFLSHSEPQVLQTNCAVRRVGCVAPWIEARAIETVSRFIQANCLTDQTILDLSNCGLFYFLTERRSATRFHLLSHVGVSPRLREVMLDDVLSAPALPALVMTQVDDPVPSDGFGQLLEMHYQRVESIGYLQFWRLRGKDGGNSPSAIGP